MCNKREYFQIRAVMLSFLVVFAVFGFSDRPAYSSGNDGPAPLAVGFDISGTVTSGGAPLAGVTVDLTGGAIATTTTDAAGGYVFIGLLDGNYMVTPSLAGYSFTPVKTAVTMAGASVPLIDFDGTVPLPGGSLDPTTIPKYVTPLVIPPVMKTTGTTNAYEIAVRQFQQQILPGGIWNTLNGRSDTFLPTTVWSYGPKADPVPTGGIAPAANSQFNYPAYTIETASNAAVSVRWQNELVAIDPATGFPYPVGSPSRTFLPHLLPGAVDQTLHWANPTGTGCTRPTPYGTDCNTTNPVPYVGPVPMVPHVHGSHVEPHSDGYPEAWWLPAASNIPAGYVTEGTLFDDAAGQAKGLNLGYADYLYMNDQPATTLWYHDHSLGMTRLNVYAGPAGFWLVRGLNDLATGLPGPAPVAGQAVLDLNVPGNPVRNAIREIPVAIQDRSFNADGSLFYPDSRSFFDTYPGPYIGSPTSTDIAPIWNPEAFFNTIVVNGTTWPQLEVAPALYRLRLLNGCNSRFLNLAMFEVDPATGNTTAVEHPFYQIGAEQGFLPNVVKVQSGTATVYPAGTVIAAPDPQQALLMGLAERADVIVDFRGLQNGTIVRMINTAPDAPFGGFPDVPSDPGTTGQVMQFVVNSALLGASPTDPGGASPATDPWLLALPAEQALSPGSVSAIRDVSLNEEESGQVCVTVDAAGVITVVLVVTPPQTMAEITATCAALGAVPQAPKAALVGIVDFTDPAAPAGVPLMWTDMTAASTMKPVMLMNGGMAMVPVTENPVIKNGVAPVEDWNIYNFTVDAHPIHLHLVRFQVIDRTPIPGVVPAPTPFPKQVWESGFKDTVIAYPGEITTVRAKFDIPGLYVWHCHIVEHEDNEMMRPYFVSAVNSTASTKLGVYDNGTWAIDQNGNGVWDGAPGDSSFFYGGMTGSMPVSGDWSGTGTPKIGIYAGGYWYLDQNGNGLWDGIPTDAMFYYGGMPGAVPVAGDWTGTGTAKIGIYADGYWYLDINGNGLWDGIPMDAMFYFGGMPGAIPVSGDWDGTGTARIGIYADGYWYLDKNGNGVWDGTPDISYFYGGMPGAIAVTGDWDVSGSSKIGVYADGTWYLDFDGDGAWNSTFDAMHIFGSAGQLPVAGK